MSDEDNQEPLIGLAALMRMAYSGVDLAPLGAQLIARAERNPADANALMDLSTVLQLRGNRETALDVQAQALAFQQLYRLPTAGSQSEIRLLAIMGPGDLMANSPLEFLLEDADVALDLLYVAPGLPLPPSLPDHDVLFVAIAQSDKNLPLLQEIASAIKSWPRPVLNKPDRIAWMSRDGACALLKSVPGVVMPVTARISRQVLEQIGHEALSITTVLEDGVFPVIVRPVDSHAGQCLEKIEHPAALADYLRTMPNGEFYVARFVDYRSPDGQFRKYRIVLIDGRPFVSHMAISDHWMIHYLNAGMADSAEKRDEEALFMADFDTGFARRHEQAFRDINKRVGLDYLGIDCGETADGKLLIFEIDSCMIVHAIDPVDVFPYKQPQMQKVFSAFREMLFNASRNKRPSRLLPLPQAGED
ncbi:glutathione synthase [Sulfuricella sp. T08]|uniref:ATP-grasp domain-containing protein n=1 Tax=Sulfuricella sp. T08 TaxID=1632857 RepID=UPI0006179A6B|nr:glutathione synthase [Sulfuricella sp. T08]GAO35721.1 glutathione synthase [Sulfuricella sp. T08]